MKRIFAPLLIAAIAHLSHANDWPSWRGPGGDGKLPADEEYPTEWSPDKNLKWKVPLPGPGNSSPIVVGERIFLTQAADQGKKRSLLCFSTKDGTLLWERSIDYGKADQTHKTNPLCSASPVSDGNLVYAWHGNGGLHAYDLEGNEKWSRDLGDHYEHQWGANAASPILYAGALIVHAGPGMTVNLFCLEKTTGETIWEKELPDAYSKDMKEFKGSWATPLIIDNDGRPEMLIGLPKALTSFNPKTGDELWRCEGLSDLCYTSAISNGEVAAYLGGFGGPGLGVRLPDSKTTGNITESHRLWADQGKKPNRQRIGTGQLIGNHLYQLDEPGIAVCLDVTTGERLWESRLSRNSWSSMNYVGGKLYVNDQSGTTYILDPNPKELKLLQENAVDQRQHTNSTLAFANGSIYLRTDAFLYSFGK